MTETYSFSAPNGVITPIVPIRIMNPIKGIILNTYALLDSGAGTCTIPASLTKALGYDFNGPSDAKTTGVSGKPIQAWKNDFVIQLLDSSEKAVLFTSPRITANCLNHDNIPAILGTDNFLKNFKITLDYPNKTIKLEL